MLLNYGVGEDLESPLYCKEIKPVNPKGNQPWIGRTDVEAEAPVLWPLDGKSWLIVKDSDARKDWGQEEKGVTKDEIVGWHYQLKGHEFEQIMGENEGQGSLACSSLWGPKMSDMTWQLNNRWIIEWFWNCQRGSGTRDFREIEFVKIL